MNQANVILPSTEVETHQQKPNKPVIFEIVTEEMEENTW